MAFALQGGHEALRCFWPRLDEPLQRLLAPRLSLFGLRQHPSHPLVAFALEAGELSRPGEAGCRYLLFAGLAGSLAVFIASIIAGLRYSATIFGSRRLSVIGGLNQSQNPLTSTAVRSPVTTVRP